MEGHTMQWTPVDSAGMMTTMGSAAGVALAEIAPHPLQYIAWGFAILSGVIATVLGIIRLCRVIKIWRHQRDR